MRKFKGRTAEGLEVYGGYYESGGVKYIVQNFQFVPVEEVSQYVGEDVDGAEVYEGDEVVAHARRYKVELKGRYGLFSDISRSKKVCKGW